MEYLSTDDMLPNTLPGHHAMPGAPGSSGILQGMQMLCSTLPGITLLKVLPGGHTPWILARMLQTTKVA